MSKASVALEEVTSELRKRLPGGKDSHARDLRWETPGAGLSRRGRQGPAQAGWGGPPLRGGEKPLRHEAQEPQDLMQVYQDCWLLVTRGRLSQASWLWDRCWQNFSGEGQTVNILGTVSQEAKSRITCIYYITKENTGFHKIFIVKIQNMVIIIESVFKINVY